MRRPVITVGERDFSRGIDARSAETQIAPGFVRDAINADLVAGRAKKRKGYQGFAGNLPVRVTEIQYDDSDNEICFILPESINLANVSARPIVVYGRTSDAITSGGPFTNAGDTVKYYATATPDVKKALLATAGAPPYESFSLPEAQTGITAPYAAVRFGRSTSSVNDSWELVEAESVKVTVEDGAGSPADYDITVEYQNSTGGDYEVYPVLLDNPVETGSVYVHTCTHTGSGSESFAVSAATHGLTNYQIGVEVYKDSTAGAGTTYDLVLPDSVTITTAGTVTVSLNTTTAATFYAVLRALPVANAVSVSAPSGTATDLTISGLSSNALIPYVYREVTAGGTLTQVEPDSITYDDATQTATITIQNYTGSAYVFKCYYTLGAVSTNKLCVTDASVSVDVTDDRPQLTIWGLDHGSIYGTNSSDREGWVTHIDSYRSATQSRVVAGLGGNLFSSYTYAEKGSSYNYASLYPRLQSTIGDTVTLSPLFHATGQTPGRNLGYITGSDLIAANQAAVTAVSYNSGNGRTLYTVTISNMALKYANDSTAPSAAAVVDRTSGTEDWLTVSQMPFSQLNGTFKIKDVTNTSDTVTFEVENSSVTSSVYDDSGCMGRAGVFTGSITCVGNEFIAGDVLSNDAVEDAGLSPEVIGVSGSAVVISGITATVTMLAGLFTTGSRTSSVIPLRASGTGGADSTANLVRGDMVSYTGLSRLLRIIYINSNDDISVNITGNGTVATATLQSGDTSRLEAGARVVIHTGDDYSGTHTILAVTSTTTFTFSSAETASVTGAVLAGHTAQVDESLPWSGTAGNLVEIRVERRWIPLEVPDDNYETTPSTRVRHLDAEDYNSTSSLRSVMVSDNMYFTDGQNEVLKFDGTNISRAGLIPWQPGLFVTVDSGATAKIVVPDPVTATVSSVVSGNVFQMSALADSSKFPVGSRVRHSYTGGYDDYTVLDSYDNGTTAFVKVSRNEAETLTAGSSPSLTRLMPVKYYLRLNAVDANDNIIASAMTSSDDLSVELATDSAVRIKAVGLPAWDAYDYDRIELQIYRTPFILPSTTTLQYFLIDSVSVDMDNTQGYIEYVDSLSDVNLISTDKVADVLVPGELGISWSDPPRAKYITTEGNRLVLANLKDYQKLDIEIEAAANVAVSDFAGKIMTFRRDSSSAATTTDMVDVARYEYISATTGNVTGITIGTDEFTVSCSGLPAVSVGDWIYLTYDSTYPGSISKTFTTNFGVDTDNIDLTAHGFSNGQQVRLSSTANDLPNGLSSSVTYYVINATTDDFSLSATLGGSAVTFSDDGTGTHTVTLQGNNLTYSGWWQVSSVSAGVSVTVALTGAAAATSYPNRYVVATDPTDVPVLLGTDGNLGMFNGNLFTLVDASRRLGLAINATMRMVDLDISGMSTFVPWMVARGGNDVGKAGRLIVRHPRASSALIEFQSPASYSNFTVKVNGSSVSAGSSTAAVEKRYPSRLVASYPGFPECFDAVTEPLDSLSDSAIDVNPSDGQEITAVIPFFGESAFGGSQQAGILVVFKEQSVYLVDLNEKARGANPVQRIESDGLGCTAPYSVTSTKNGVSFANEFGPFILRRNLKIDPVGLYMLRQWERVNRDRLDLIQGHNRGTDRVYILSVPVGEDTECTEYQQYNYEAEDLAGSVGGWTRGTGFRATGWANLGKTAYMATADGRVLVRRSAGDETDYRDDSSAISFQLDTRATDFGDPAVRKTVLAIVGEYRVSVDNSGTAVSTSTDTSNSYQPTTEFSLSSGSSDVQSVSSDTSRSRGRVFQTRIVNAAIDEDLEVAGINYRVAGLTERGIKPASSTN